MEESITTVDEVFICKKCYNTEHQLIFSLFPNDKVDKNLYVSVHLNPTYNNSEKNLECY